MFSDWAKCASFDGAWAFAMATVESALLSAQVREEKSDRPIDLKELSRARTKHNVQISLYN